MVLVPATGVGVDAVLVTRRSASGAVGWVAVEELLPLAGSGVLAEADEVIDRVGAAKPGSTASTTSAVKVAPGARVPTTQVSVPALTVHPSVAQTTVVPSGSGMLITTSRAVDGPALVTVVVSTVCSVPGTTGPLSELVTCRSADWVTVTGTVAVLLTETSSAVVPATRTELITTPPAVSALTLATTGIETVVALATVPSEQVTVCPDGVHVTPAGGEVET
ncbi:hypothetical protein Aglo03_15360 [Actinokineospora globicatena]|uniref:Uncharacterized protein n=1 Tax=Actinokineospora globicatena TaxID=103729 RepID=A0A9W6QJA5_9PSEU|nr:hypothetical protein Aglo03_15360 [Actinokineospora globicatena]